MLETPKAFLYARHLLWYAQIIYKIGEDRDNQKDETMDNQQERFEIRLAWLAAIIEGEGWVSLAIVSSWQKNGKTYPAFVANIGCTNTDLKIMQEVEDIFIALNIKYRKQIRPAYTGSDGISRKLKRELSVGSRENFKKLANAILPFMIGEKKERIIKIFEYFKIREQKPKTGKNAAHGEDEYLIYKELYSYKGKSRSKILNDYMLNIAQKSDKDRV